MIDRTPPPPGSPSAELIHACVEGNLVGLLQALGGSRANFNFSNARPVAAMAATSLDLSNVDFLADSSAAGSSYGAGNLLTTGVRNAMKQKQNEWVDIFHRVFEALGLGRPRMFFQKMEDVEPYRAAQALTLLAPTLHDEEYRMKSLDILDIVGNSDDIPDTLKNRGVDANASANAGVQQAAPDQGKSSGVGPGGGQGANDLRSDTLSSSEALRREMALESLAERIERAVGRFEELSK